MAARYAQQEQPDTVSVVGTSCLALGGVVGSSKLVLSKRGRRADTCRRVRTRADSACWLIQYRVDSRGAAI